LAIHVKPKRIPILFQSTILQHEPEAQNILNSTSESRITKTRNGSSEKITGITEQEVQNWNKMSSFDNTMHGQAGINGFPQSGSSEQASIKSSFHTDESASSEH
jgi:hypothetical protein